MQALGTSLCTALEKAEHSRVTDTDPGFLREQQRHGVVGREMRIGAAVRAAVLGDPAAPASSPAAATRSTASAACATSAAGSVPRGSSGMVGSATSWARPHDEHSHIFSGYTGRTYDIWHRHCLRSEMARTQIVHNDAQEGPVHMSTEPAV
jgi:hypothetical protein